jgi:hypothetical protein
MASVIKIKHNETASAVPADGQLAKAELAINLADKKLYSSTDGTDIITVAGATADTLTDARNIALTGDITGTVSFNGSQDVSISTTIAENSVALGTDTTGNYVSDVSGTANEVEVTHTPGEGSTATIGLPDDVTIAGQLNVTQNIVASGNVAIGGNLTVTGATTYISSSTVSVDDSALKLSANNVGDTVDTGVYGLYIDTETNKYAGYFRDASDSGKFKFYTGLQSEPTTTVDDTGTGYVMGEVVAIIDGGTYSSS